MTIESSLIARISASEMDWRRLGSRALIAALMVAAVMTVARNALGSQYGFDFHGGMWQAGRDLLAGRSPYLPPNAHQLLVAGNALITPPLLAVIAIPFAVLPFGLGVALWNLVCAGAFAGAISLLGVRDRRLLLIAMCSFPFVSSLILGQPDGLFALAAAIAWRWRDSWPGAVAVGALIAAKLLAWPLLLWLLVTRRVRGFAIALGSAAALLLLSWAPIGFKGLIDYPRLLAADARAFATRSHSIVAAAMRLGLSQQIGTVLAIICAAVVAVAILRLARDRDQGYFGAAIMVGLLASPLLWSHYLVLLLVPLAIARPRTDRLWRLTAVFWLSPIEPAHGWQIALVLATAVTISIAAGSRTEFRPWRVAQAFR
jgi:alpha-1,2-mannosyltransferase